MSNASETLANTVLSCCICETLIPDNKPRLRCASETCNKLTCSSCIHEMIEAMFGQPTLNYPFKCAACLQICDQSIFHDIIVEQGQYEKYIACIFPLYWTKDCLEPNEILAQCKYL